MSHRIIRIHERHVEGKRLGRHIEHDEASRSFAVPHIQQVIATSKTWERKCPAYNQGQLGSCTANAGLGCLMTEPYWNGSWQFTEDDCVKVYEEETLIDNIEGSYPPDDTGSSGLAFMRVAKNLGYIQGYHHAFSLPAVLMSLQRGPGITGINWYEGFDQPDETGYVQLSGDVRGGHELEVYGYDLQASNPDGTIGAIHMWNSWDTTYGIQGSFSMSIMTYTRLLLQEHGDFTAPII